MEIKKFVLYEDMIKPTLQRINPMYKANFVSLDFNKISSIRFMKDVTRVGDSYEIPVYFTRFQVYGFDEMPEYKPNYITFAQLWKKELLVSLIEKVS